MKNNLFLLLIFLLPTITFAQKRKLFKESNISVSTAFNWDPNSLSYSWSDQFLTADQDLILIYNTRASGTFFIEENDSILVTRNQTTDLNTQSFGLGTTLRFSKVSGFFQEFSITKLSFSESFYTSIFDYERGMIVYQAVRSGQRQKSAVVGIRYEFGKVFGDPKNSRIQFGFSGGLAPTMYRFKRIPGTSAEYTVKVNIVTVDATLIPMLTARLSKKVSIDFKVLSSVIIDVFGTTNENNPNQPISQQEGDLDYNIPELDFAFSLGIRYTLKEAVIPKKKRKKRKKRRW